MRACTVLFLHAESLCPLRAPKYSCRPPASRPSWPRVRNSCATRRVLVVTPTRELAAQCHTMLGRLTQFCAGISAALITGGAKNLRAQEAELRTGPDVVVCTPGRMVDHLTNSAGTHLDNLETLVLDEADRLLEMGFTDEVRCHNAHMTSGSATILSLALFGVRRRRSSKLSVRAPAVARPCSSRRLSTPVLRSSQSFRCVGQCACLSMSDARLRRASRRSLCACEQTQTVGAQRVRRLCSLYSRARESRTRLRRTETARA